MLLQDLMKSASESADPNEGFFFLLLYFFFKLVTSPWRRGAGGLRYGTNELLFIAAPFKSLASSSHGSMVEGRLSTRDTIHRTYAFLRRVKHKKASSLIFRQQRESWSIRFDSFFFLRKRGVKGVGGGGRELVRKGYFLKGGCYPSCRPGQ